MSDIATVEQTVHATISEVLGVTAEALVAEPALAVHHWDSLSSLYAFTELERRLGITLDLRTFHTAHTVVEVVALATAATTRRERVA